MRFKTVLKTFSLLFLFCLFSCGTQKPLETTDKIKTVLIKEIVHDTILETEIDSSSYRALLECQNGKVVIKPSTKKQKLTSAKKGKYLEVPKVIITDNILNVDCVSEAQELFFKWKSEYIKETTDTTIQKPIYIEKQLTSWEEFQIWCGRIFLFTFFFVIIKFLLKLYKPISL